MELLFSIGAAAFALSTAGYFASLWSRREGLERIAHAVFAVTLIYWLGLLVGWFAVGGVGMRTWLGVSAWSLGALYMGLLWRYPIGALGSFVSGLGTILALLALFVVHPLGHSGDAAPSWLLRVHIVMALIGVTSLAFAGAASVLYLLQSQMLKRKTHGRLRRRLPSLDVLDRLSLRGIVVGFPFYTVALLAGSARAIEGSENGGIKTAYLIALVSWAIYGAVLQARLMAGWRGRRAAVLTAIGMVAALVVVAQYSLGLK